MTAIFWHYLLITTIYVHKNQLNAYLHTKNICLITIPLIKKVEKIMNKLIQQDITQIQNLSIFKKFGHYTCVNLSLYEDIWHIVPYYWRLIDEKFSLVEIGIDPVTGQFLSINVVLYNDFIRWNAKDNIQQSQPIAKMGIPTFSKELWGVVDTEDFRQRFYDVHGKTQLALDENNLEIVLFNEEISYQIEFPEQLSYKFNSSRELCTITIHDLSDSELQSLRNYESLHSENAPLK